MPLGQVKNVSKQLDQWREFHKPFIHSRPDFNRYFLTISDKVSTRSSDPTTQHGCVLVSKDNAIISTGYNGFVRDIDDSVLPNLAPHKYQFMIHAELNAILNATRHGKSTIDATAYITGPPCNMCIQYMYQAGINKVVHGGKKSNCMQNEKEQVIGQILQNLTGIEIIEISSTSSIEKRSI